MLPDFRTLILEVQKARPQGFDFRANIPILFAHDLYRYLLFLYKN